VIHEQTVVFVSEDDLWTVSANGGIARRLTSGLGTATHPAISIDGNWIAFSGREEGPAEVFVMPFEGGQPRRVTFVGTPALVVGWTPQGEIVYASDSGQPFVRIMRLFAVSREGGESRELPTGPAAFISYGADGGCVIARPAVEAAYWKRYRGGTTGDLWIDAAGDGDWRRLIKVQGNPSRPLWIATRIYFISDHDGVGNLYSCDPSGQNLRQHTDHDDFYVRGAASDGKRIVYHAGADLFVFDPTDDQSRKLEVRYHSPRTQRNRKFIETGKYLESYAPHAQGHLLALTTRGKIAAMGNWDGPVQQVGEPHAGRYRMAQWLNDGERIVAVSDAEGCEGLVILHTDGLKAPERVTGMDLSRLVSMKVSPKGDQVAIANVRNELILVDLPTKQCRVLDRSEHAPLWGFSFSPDGKWIAYEWSATLHTSIIKLVRLEDGARFPVTRAVLWDASPAFDPEGKYLYFLSRREFDPVYDQLHFDLGFPKGMRPYLVTLRKDVPSPFALVPKPPEDKKEKNAKAQVAGADSDEATPSKETPLAIDIEGIEDRVQAFPVPDGIYRQIEGIKGKALFTSVPVEGSLSHSWIPGGEPPAKATLEMFDFDTGIAEIVVKDITDFQLSGDRKTLVYRAGNRLRLVKTGEKPDENAAKEAPGRKSGWVDLKRVRIYIEPPNEWKQMYGEAWRMQKDQFWVEDMADVDWHEIYERYRPLLERVSTREEFADLLWEMQGELGSSHAYVMGGDFREEPQFDVGFLGVKTEWDDEASAWKIARIVRGDPWKDEKGSPLLRPGVNAHEGDVILAINGRRTSGDVSPAQLLVNQAGMEVALTLGEASSGREPPRTVMVKTLKNEMPLYYREWVEKNRTWVHEQTAGRGGYVHIPDMGPSGYAEFHRYFLSEIDRDGLIVDARFNRGGHVSALLLEKLARKRLGYVQTRWFGVHPWPEDSPTGPLVALTNEFAGSDGDIFSHNFKTMKLGPLIGKRTWGGVIGIWPRHTLADGGVTTQPEFSFWFKDIGWQVENYGVDPDIEVDYPPQDYLAGRDPQLRRGVDELMKQLQEYPREVQLPLRPSRAWRRIRDESAKQGEIKPS
jgi:tricorn protease